jgi:hypothetical protein
MVVGDVGLFCCCSYWSPSVQLPLALCARSRCAAGAPVTDMDLGSLPPPELSALPAGRAALHVVEAAGATHQRRQMLLQLQRDLPQVSHIVGGPLVSDIADRNFADGIVLTNAY